MREGRRILANLTEQALELAGSFELGKDLVVGWIQPDMQGDGALQGAERLAVPMPGRVGAGQRVNHRRLVPGCIQQAFDPANLGLEGLGVGGRKRFGRRNLAPERGRQGESEDGNQRRHGVMVTIS